MTKSVKSVTHYPAIIFLVRNAGDGRLYNEWRLTMEYEMNYAKIMIYGEIQRVICPLLVLIADAC